MTLIYKIPGAELADGCRLISSVYTSYVRGGGGYAFYSSSFCGPDSPPDSIPYTDFFTFYPNLIFIRPAGTVLCKLVVHVQS